MDVRQQVLEAFDVNLLYARELPTATPEGQFATVPFANMKHPAWIAGHITLPHRRVAKELGAQIEIPEGWVELLGASPFLRAVSVAGRIARASFLACSQGQFK